MLLFVPLWPAVQHSTCAVDYAVVRPVFSDTLAGPGRALTHLVICYITKLFSSYCIFCAYRQDINLSTRRCSGSVETKCSRCYRLVLMLDLTLMFVQNLWEAYTPTFYAGKSFVRQFPVECVICLMPEFTM